MSHRDLCGCFYITFPCVCAHHCVLLPHIHLRRTACNNCQNTETSASVFFSLLALIMKKRQAVSRRLIMFVMKALLIAVRFFFTPREDMVWTICLLGYIRYCKISCSNMTWVTFMFVNDPYSITSVHTPLPWNNSRSQQSL